MLEKSIVLELHKIVSNVAGLDVESPIKIKAKKLWKTAHRISVPVVNKEALGDPELLSGLTSLDHSENLLSGKQSKVLLEAGVNLYTLTLGVMENSLVITIAPTLAEMEVTCYLSHYSHTLRLGETLDSKTTCIVERSGASIGLDVGMFDVYEEAAVKAMLTTSYKLRKKLIKKEKKSGLKKDF